MWLDAVTGWRSTLLQHCIACDLIVLLCQVATEGLAAFKTIILQVKTLSRILKFNINSSLSFILLE